MKLSQQFCSCSKTIPYKFRSNATNRSQVTSSFHFLKKGLERVIRLKFGNLFFCQIILTTNQRWCSIVVARQCGTTKTFTGRLKIVKISNFQSLFHSKIHFFEGKMQFQATSENLLHSFRDIIAKLFQHKLSNINVTSSKIWFLLNAQKCCS